MGDRRTTPSRWPTDERWTGSYYPENSRYPFALPGGQPQAIADAKSQIVALQSGTADHPISRAMTSPRATTAPTTGSARGPCPRRKDHGAPGPFLYHLAGFAPIGDPLPPCRDNTAVGVFKLVHMGRLDGATIHQWALQTPDGKGGFLELSPAAAAVLFGTGPLVAASPNPVAYKGGGSYFDFKIPGDGLATRFEVFTQWGKDTPG